MSKDMVWHELFDRMKNDQCPICKLIQDRIDSSMDGLLYESVNDITICGKIYGSKGFCNFHAYMLLKKGDPLAHAILYSDLINNAVKDISDKKSKNRFYQNHEGCIFCEQERESESNYLNTFISAYSDIEFMNRYRESGMLCLPHLELVKVSKKQNIDLIINDTIEKYRKLLGNLSEIKRKSDYRFSDEKWTNDEKASWKKAVGVINADPGIRK